ncbi:MAG: transglutaminase-like domain-containing protein [Pseudomonadales bacterium]|nr:transglutaminase-like domain-containing protein [Pseudomonadales bacterium]
MNLKRNFEVLTFLALFICFVIAAYIIGSNKVYRAFQDEPVKQEFSTLKPEFETKRLFKYSFIATNTTNLLIENVQITTFSPIEVTSFQKLENVHSNYPFTVQKGMYGNRFLQFQLDQLEPYGAKVIEIQVELGFSKQSISGLYEDGSFLGPEKYIETDFVDLISVAKGLKAESDLETAQNIMHWVSTHIVDPGFIASDLGAKYAYENKRGDCSEYSYLSAALARINGIPARVIAGFVMSDDGVLKARDYHNWTELYLDGSWRILDAQKGYFNGENNASYLGMRILGDTESLLAKSQRYSVSSESVNVGMQ